MQNEDNSGRKVRIQREYWDDITHREESAVVT